MDYVCEDTDGDWFFYPDEQIYRRLKGEQKEIWATIKGEYLPDPNLLLSKRRKLYPHAAIDVISPTQATYKLWSDWNARK